MVNDLHKSLTFTKTTSDKIVTYNDLGHAVIDGVETSMTENVYNIALDSQNASIDVFRELDRVCRENEITYFVVSGALLGLVRSGDLIPWDDDIDVAMHRKDLEKLIKCKDCFRYPYKLYVASPDDGFFYNFGARVENTERLVNKENIEMEFFQYHNHVRPTVDILSLDSTLGGRHYRSQNFLMHISYGLGMSKRPSVDYARYSKALQKAQVWLLRTLGSRMSLSTIFSLNERIIKKYANNSGADYVFYSNVNPPDLAPLPAFDRSWFDYPFCSELRGLEIPIPNGFHEYLSSQFGNYLEPPPVKDRKPIHFARKSIGKG